ncbi:MAG TPA: PH domain-containing protein [Patescibacteria group bacterium]|jgi:uncharacterized membrane protein YdbT with pleckstrin-like domain|nr:PH domain-containing protein [Patescibacteria group bacterium]
MNIALKDFEHIRQIYRQSPFVLIHPLVVSGLAVVLPLYAVVRYASGNSALRTALLIWAILVIGHALRLIIIWRLNTYVITNQRILHYAQKGLFDQTITETPHERVLNVSYKSEGFTSRVVGYGDVIVQVVGLMEPIVLKNISTPIPIKDYLWEMHKRIAQDKSNAVFDKSDATHVQEQVGYTKHNSL